MSPFADAVALVHDNLADLTIRDTEPSEFIPECFNQEPLGGYQQKPDATASQQYASLSSLGLVQSTGNLLH